MMMTMMMMIIIIIVVTSKKGAQTLIPLRSLKEISRFIGIIKLAYIAYATRKHV